MFDTMKEVLAEGEKIKISGFGNFVVRDKSQRWGRNPQTGEPIPISARSPISPMWAFRYGSGSRPWARAIGPKFHATFTQDMASPNTTKAT